MRCEHDLRPLREEWDLMWRAWRITPPEPATTDTIEGRQINRRGSVPLNPFLASFTVPYRFHAVETLLPRILGDDPKITYEARDHDEDDPVAKIMSCLVQEQLEDMDFDLEVRDFIRQALITNYSVAKVYWNRETHMQTRTVTSTVPDEKIHGVSYNLEQDAQEVVVDVNEPGFEVVDVRDFVWPLTSKSIQKAPFVWQRRWVTRGYLEAMQQAGHYQNVNDIGLVDATTEWANSRREQLDQQKLSVSAPTRQKKDPEDIIEIWERWTNTHVHVLADPRGSNILLRDEASPFHHGRKPFVDYTPIPVIGQHHGMSIVRTIYDLAEDLDTKRRQVADALTYILNPMWYITDSVDRTQLVAEPGGIVQGDTPEDAPIPMINPQIDFAAFGQYESRVYDDMQRTSGASTWLDGTAGLSSTSATGVATVVQEANKRLTEMVKVFDRRSMRELARQMWRNNEQFLDEGIAVDLSKDPSAAQAFQAYIEEAQQTDGVPPNGIAKVPPELLRSDGRLRPVPIVGQDYEMSKQQKTSDAVQLGAAIAPGIPVLAQQGFDFKAFYAYLMEEMGVPKDVRDAVNAAPPPQALPLGGVPSPNGGPGGDNLPSGLPPGAPGVPGPSGSYGMATNGKP